METFEVLFDELVQNIFEEINHQLEQYSRDCLFPQRWNISLKPVTEEGGLQLFMLLGIIQEPTLLIYLHKESYIFID